MTARRGDPGPARAVRFINNLPHTKGACAGHPFALRAWQERIVRRLFRMRKDGRRQYRTALLMLPRKNGKTELAAAIALYGLFGDGEMGARSLQRRRRQGPGVVVLQRGRRNGPARTRPAGAVRHHRQSKADRSSAVRFVLPRDQCGGVQQAWPGRVNGRVRRTPCRTDARIVRRPIDVDGRARESADAGHHDRRLRSPFDSVGTVQSRRPRP